jgi:N-acetylneuraminic acid mutarotase
MESATAATIGDKIYVVGGHNTTGVLASLYVYDPAADSWSSGKPLPVATNGGAALAYQNVLYVFGGATSDGKAQKTVFAYTPATGKWARVTKLHIATIDPGAVIIGKTGYIVGGVTGNTRLNAVQLYDFATGKLKRGKSLLVGKSEPSVGVAGTTIIAAGGYTANGDTGDDEGLPAHAANWSPLPAEPDPANASCTGVIKSKLYVMAGTKDGPPVAASNAFAIATNSWASLAVMPQSLGGAASAVYKGKLYCFGGADRDVGGNYFATTQIYTP